MCVYIHDGKVCMLGTNTHLNNPPPYIYLVCDYKHTKSTYDLSFFAFIRIFQSGTRPNNCVFTSFILQTQIFYSTIISLDGLNKRPKKKNEYTCNPFLIVNEQKYFKLKTVHNFFYLLIQTVNHGGSLTNVTSLEYLV